MNNKITKLGASGQYTVLTELWLLFYIYVTTKLLTSGLLLKCHLAIPSSISAAARNTQQITYFEVSKASVSAGTTQGR